MDNKENYYQFKLQEIKDDTKYKLVDTNWLGKYVKANVWFKPKQGKNAHKRYHHHNSMMFVK